MRNLIKPFIPIWFLPRARADLVAKDIGELKELIDILPDDLKICCTQGEGCRLRVTEGDPTELVIDNP